MKEKKFDCVKMKHDIQQQLMKEFEGLSPEEQWRLTEERILADPYLGPVWKRARKIHPDEPAPAFTPGPDKKEKRSE